MKTIFEERANIHRWWLLAMNGVLAIGMFFIWVSYGSPRHFLGFWVDIPDYAYYYELKGYKAISGICLTFSTIALILIPALHVLKLFGVMGEKVRESRAVSVTFSVIELLGALVMPVSYIIVSCNSNPSLTLREAFGPVTGWACLWIELIAVALILSVLMRRTEPIFENDTEEVEQRGSELWYCPSCGRMNAPRYARCKDCGAERK